MTDAVDAKPFNFGSELLSKHGRNGTPSKEIELTTSSRKHFASSAVVSENRSAIMIRNNNGQHSPGSGSGHVDVVAQNIDAIAQLQERAERHVTPQQRLIENVTLSLGRPRTIFIIAGIVALWVVANIIAHSFGYNQVDPPPFYWLQGAIGLSALFSSVMVLATQNRQGRTAEQRDHLELQAMLLTEQKVTKLIGLIEDLRRDLPNVENRVDDEAEALREPLDPNVVLTALEVRLDHALDDASLGEMNELDRPLEP